jgi:hypothetical protein
MIKELGASLGDKRSWGSDRRPAVFEARGNDAWRLITERQAFNKTNSTQKQSGRGAAARNPRGKMPQFYGSQRLFWYLIVAVTLNGASLVVLTYFL